MTYILDLIGTIILLTYGVITVLFPYWVAPFIAQKLDSPRGAAEFRVIHGGFAAMAIFALVVNEPLVFTLLGIGWLGAAAVRLLAIPFDRPALNATYLISFVFELVFGLIMVVA